jgi:hypothetical protein
MTSDRRARSGSITLPSFAACCRGMSSPSRGRFSSGAPVTPRSTFCRCGTGWRSTTFFSIDDNKDYLDQLVAQPRSGIELFQLPARLRPPFDFIFIDGRRRLECALVASLLCHPDTVVVLHDYRRSRYQPVKVIYDIVEDGPQFRVMRLRKDLHAAERMRGLQAA